MIMMTQSEHYLCINIKCKQQPATTTNYYLLLNRPPARRLTPVTVQTQSRTSLTEHNGATLTSNNTLHRRTDDISVGFFTNRTLDEIHDDGGDGGGDGYQIGTPHCQQQQQHQNTGNNINNNNNHRVVYQTPGNRVRIDSDSFRRTIKVVTCEKRRMWWRCMPNLLMLKVVGKLCMPFGW